MTRPLFALSLGFSLGFAALVLVSHQARAEARCAPRDLVLAELAGRYGETRRGLGITANAAVVEVFASDATGSWTITATLPDGTTCLVASGEAWEALAEELPAKGDPA